jgi:hypothetical protein
VADRGFTCAKCGGTFTKGRSDEQAAAEHRKNMPEVPTDEPTALLCDPCYRQFVAWLEAHPEERVPTKEQRR